MKTEKQFNATISYYKIVTLFALVMCAVLLPFKSFDPLGPMDLKE